MRTGNTQLDDDARRLHEIEWKIDRLNETGDAGRDAREGKHSPQRGLHLVNVDLGGADHAPTLSNRPGFCVRDFVDPHSKHRRGPLDRRRTAHSGRSDSKQDYALWVAAERLALFLFVVSVSAPIASPAAKLGSGTGSPNARRKVDPPG